VVVPSSIFDKLGCFEGRKMLLSTGMRRNKFYEKITSSVVDRSSSKSAELV
jgi:hypothetical protein